MRGYCRLRACRSAAIAIERRLHRRAQHLEQALRVGREVVLAQDRGADVRFRERGRQLVLRERLAEPSVRGATAEGVPVNGYFYWSSQDNFEWNAGFGNRFGVIYVDFDTLARTPKLSAEWFREAARTNTVV